MSYIQVSFETDKADVQAILIAMLSENGYEGFEEQDAALKAFVPAAHFDEPFLNELSEEYQVPYQKANIEDQNWNAKWEENFQPVIIDDFCSITAHFHKLDVQTQYHIRITPKMSFGTGHHATTRLMIKSMKDIDFVGKHVLDFGSGTGVLAILAQQLGADKVIAIDNDEWAYLNATDNISTNKADKVEAIQGVLDDITNEKYNVILANINRHILLQYMQQLSAMLQPAGTLLMSGLLCEDEGIIIDAAKSAALKLVSRQEDSNWICLLFQK